MKRIVFIDDDVKAGQLFRRFAEEENYHVDVYTDPVEAVNDFSGLSADVVITDLKMPSLSGTDVLSMIREQDAGIPVILVTGFSTLDDAIEALRLGATDFVKKPYDTEELLRQIERTLESQALRHENVRLKKELAQLDRHTMIGETAVMDKLRHIIRKVADIRCNVIIQGESGTGKELVARALHNQSQFSDKPFIVIDCGALTESLLESELFGHEKGAFTGAEKTHKGLIESAAGGTVFLDEICNISDALQTRLLRVVQEQQITRVGGVTPVDIDVRFVAATNRNIEEMVRQGSFREDLYHRLNVVKIEVPTLRERSDDIPLLINHFLQLFNEKYHSTVHSFDQESLLKLMSYSWPGNVRECRNLVERMLVLSDGNVLEIEEGMLATKQATCFVTEEEEPDLKTLERLYILKTLERYNNNKEKTAQVLGINASTLWRKLRLYQSG